MMRTGGLTKPRPAPTFFVSDSVRERLDELRRISEAAPIHIDKFSWFNEPENVALFHLHMAPQIRVLPNHYYVSLLSLYGGPAGHARWLKVIRSGTRRRVNHDFAWELALLVGFRDNQRGMDTWTETPGMGMGRSISFQQYYGEQVMGQLTDPALPRRMPQAPDRRPAGRRT